MKKLLLLFLLLALPGYATEPAPAELNDAADKDKPMYAMLWQAMPPAPFPVKPIPVASRLPLFDVVTTIKPSTTGGGGGGGGVSAGSPAAGCLPSTLLWVDASGNVQCGTPVLALGSPFVTLGNTPSAPAQLTLASNNGSYIVTLKQSSTVGLNIDANTSFGGFSVFPGNAANTATRGSQFTIDPAVSVGDVGIGRVSAGVLKITDATSGYGVIRGADGVIATPTYSFASTPNSGLMYASGGPQLVSGGVSSLLAQGSTQVEIASSAALTWSASVVGIAPDTGFARAAAGVVKVTGGTVGDGAIRVGDGAVATPSIGFSSFPNTGLFTKGGGGVAVAVLGAEQAFFDAGGVSTTAGKSYRIGASTLGSAAGAGIFTMGAFSFIQNTNGEGALSANYTNATATFSNTNLSRSLNNGLSYTFDMSLFVSESTAVDGWQIDFNGGTAGAATFIVNCASASETGTAVALVNATSSALGTVINAATTGTTGSQVIVCHGFITLTGVGGINTIVVRAAQNTHSAGTLTIKAGSNIAFRSTPTL